MTTNDQKRMAEVLPLVEGADPGSATLLSRMFLQGADPLFIAKMAPESIERLATILEITSHEVMVAIEGAHKMGPGIFESGEECGWNGDPQHYERHHAGEVAWLILAGCSHDNEHGFTEEVKPEARMLMAFDHVRKFDRIMDENPTPEFGWNHHARILDIAKMALETFRAKTKFEWDDTDPESVPTTDVDCGFYIGYKEGFSCVAVKAPGMTFYGTTAPHTLEEQGVTVDKLISPTFGIIFDKESAQ